MPRLGVGIGLGIQNSLVKPIPIALGASFLITVSPRFCCSDASHLVPCNNGDQIVTWYEQVTKTWFSWASVGGAGSKPVFNVSGSFYSANMVTNGQFPFANSWPQNDVSWTIRFTPNAQAGHYLGEGSDSGDKPYTYYRATTTGVLQRFNTGPSVALTNGSNACISYQGTGTAPVSTEKMRINGGAWATVNNTRPTRSGTSATVAVGIGGAGGGGFSNFKGLAIFPTILSNANFALVENYFNSL